MNQPEDESLEPVLRAAFGPEDSPPPKQEVLDRLAMASGSDSRLALRDPPGEHGPVALPLSPEAAAAAKRIGRYELSGEIAHGGMGIVLKGRDTELGREVAVKLLLGAIEPERLQRFLEEAQIAGQLQHPGVVPVHELGLAADGRPYFAMKLVKGRTLAVLLEGRGELGQERRRFLSVFEQVCQTVAYAHARGVAHRDLKPTNIMVGAFGEVLVMDWGLAKVLSQGGVADERRAPESAVVRTVRSSTPGTASLEGSVLGTPAYMAPEQARGEVDQLDERADVFALGALLCEILTGRPPYLGASWEERWRQAKEGALQDAFLALEGCGADRELIDLARHCLAAERRQRPRDAGVVAEKINKHLAAVEERAQGARLQAVAAEAKAHEERRVRRFAVALATSVVLAVALCSGGYLWYAHERGLRAEETARRVGAAMQKASELRGQAASAAPEEIEAWRLALAAGGYAVELARTGGATAEVTSCAEQLLAELREEEHKAQERAQRAEADRLMVERLDEIRAEAKELAQSRLDAAYAAAFQHYGIDVEAQDPEAAAESVRASAIHAELAVALDAWIEVRRQRQPQRDWERLDKVVRAADPDAWRTKLRDAMRTKDQALLRELADAPGLADLPVQSLVLLGRYLRVSGDRDRAVAVLKTALDSHRDDYRLNVNLGAYLGEMLLLPNVPAMPCRIDEGLRFATAAVALRPRHASAWLTLGHILQAKGEGDEAMVAYQKILAIKPDSHAHMHVGRLLAEKGEHDAAITSFKESIRLGPFNAEVYTNLGQALKAKGEPQEANDAFETAIAVHKKGIDSATPSWQDHFGLGYALHNRGQLEEAITAYRTAIGIEPRVQDVHQNLGTALGAQGKLDQAIDAFLEALRVEPQNYMAHFRLGLTYKNRGDLAKSKGDLAKSRGDLEQAIAAFRATLSIAPRFFKGHQMLGLSLTDRDDLEEAILEFQKAIDIEPKRFEAHLGLGNALTLKKDYNRAIEAFLEVLSIEPNNHQAYNSLGQAYQWNRDVDHAIDAYKKAVSLKEDFDWPHFRLGQCYSIKGQFTAALESFRRGSELGNQRAAKQLPVAEDLARLADQLPAILNGEVILTGAEQHSRVVTICYRKRLYAAAAAFWDSTFQAGASLAASGHLDAVRAAALAASGQGDAATLDESGRGRWRGQACAWLRAELARQRAMLASGATPEQTVSTLQRWKTEPDLSGIREAEALATLPESDREACRALWAEVDAQIASLLASIGNPATQPHGTRK